jgi:8-oxo-dGTP diphosphatase
LDKQEAKRINLHIVKKSLSEQSLGFSSKIKEVDEFLWENPQYKGRIRESHPEFGFSILNGGKPLMSKKRESIGIAERRLLLSKHFTDAEKALDEIMSQYPKFLVDDFVDAMVLAVIGRNGMENGFETIPQQPVNDSRGLLMQIAYGRMKGGK